MHLIYETLKKTGGKTDGDSLIAAAKGMKWESPRGPMSIDPETRDIVQTVYIRKVEKVDGELAQRRVRQGRERQGPGQGADGEVAGARRAAIRGPAPRTVSISASGSSGAAVAAPGDVAVGAHQHQRAGRRARAASSLSMRCTASGTPRLAAARSIASVGASAKFSSTKPSPNRSRIDRSGASQTCGARAPGNAVGSIAEGVVGGLRRAVRHHDRRRMVDVAEMHADRMPGLFVLLDQPLADRAPRGLAFRRRRIDLGALRGADQAAVVLQRHLGGARRRRPPLVIVAFEQRRRRPSPAARRQASSRDRRRPGCRCSCRARRSADARARHRRRGTRGRP